ncbi:MAG: TonB-dependent receptor domain-containing protein [Gemmatimonadaceae bacterium]
MRQLLCRIGPVLALSLWFHDPLAAQQAGTITGRVVDAATQQQLPEVQVVVVGTTRGARTGPDGTYRIVGIPAGQVRLRTQRLGYQPATQTVTVEATQEATANFSLTAAATNLEQVVVTATGAEARLREQGNSVAAIDVDSIALAPIQSFSQLVIGRAAGVSVLQSSGTVGTGTRIRIRGANSVSLTNEPLVIIDGVRVNSAAESNSIAVGGQLPSRINDINPEDIESIEILKGPAATGLYGTQAANGVIQITTKQGRVGATRWSFFAEAGQSTDEHDYPPNFGGWTTDAGDRFIGCDLISQSFGLCTVDSLAAFNPLRVHSPFRTGNRQAFGTSVSGGSERVTYYLSADYDNEDGVYRTNALERLNLRANLTANLRDDLSLRVSTGYLDSELRLPQNDNNFLGYISNGLAGFAFDTETQGYDPIGPELIDQIDTRQDLTRYLASVNASYSPFGWLRLNSTVGIDLFNRHDSEFFPTGAIDFFGLGVGSRESNRTQVTTTTANLSSTATFSLTPELTSSTSAGFQYQRDLFEQTAASGEGLAGGTGTLGGATSRFLVDETFTDTKLAGGYLTQQFGWRDRLFVQLGVRGDDNSAFGENFGVVYYPTASVSWVMSDEPWFPQSSVLSSFRVRGAFGESGLRPENRDAIVFFDPVAVRVQGVEVPGVTLGGIGDPNLEPERTRELEVGLDATLLSDRVNLELTYYDRKSRNALIARTLPASTGFPEERFENIGSVLNRGVEALLGAELLQLDNVRFGVTVTASYNDNELLELGEGIEPIIFGTQRHVEGRSLGGYWDIPILGFDDANGDGFISDDEIELGEEEVFIGNSLPSRQASLATDLTLFDRVKITTLFDYRGGFYQDNSSENFRCAILTCRGVNDIATPPALQARSVAAAFGLVQSGFIEKADFVKLREVAVTFTAPERWAARVNARGLSLTLAGRNLKTWTDYTGVDPEVNSGAQANFTQFDFLSQPPVRTLTARVNLTF